MIKSIVAGEEMLGKIPNLRQTKLHFVGVYFCIYEAAHMHGQVEPDHFNPKHLTEVTVRTNTVLIGYLKGG